MDNKLKRVVQLASDRGLNHTTLKSDCLIYSGNLAPCSYRVKVKEREGLST